MQPKDFKELFAIVIKILNDEAISSLNLGQIEKVTDLYSAQGAKALRG